MTNSTNQKETTNPSRNRTETQSLHIIPARAENAPLLENLTAIVTELLSNNAYTVVNYDEIPSWEPDNPCSECGSYELHVLRAREDAFIYNDELGEMEYNGHVDGTVETASEPIQVTCAACNTVLLDTPYAHLLHIDTL